MALPCSHDLPSTLRALCLPRSVPYVHLLFSWPMHRCCYSADSLDWSYPWLSLALELKLINLGDTFNISVSITHLKENSPALFCCGCVSVHGNRGEFQVHAIASSPELALDWWIFVHPRYLWPITIAPGQSCCGTPCKPLQPQAFLGLRPPRRGWGPSSTWSVLLEKKYFLCLITK